jgi:two-component system phosphate regulon sensor histidine kinase PhoR
MAGVFAIAWGWSLYGPLQDAAITQQQHNLTAVARTGAQYADVATSTAPQIANRIAQGNDLRVTIVARDGKVLADSENNPATMGNHLDRPEIAAALAGGVGTSRRTSATEGVAQLYVAVPAVVAGKPVALRVSQPMTQVESIARTSRRLGLALLAIALVIAVGIATWASGAASRPLLELSSAAERMADGNLAVEMPSMPTDLEALAASLETLRRQMRSRLDALESEQRTLRTALDGLTDAVFLLDGCEIQYANGAADRMFHAPARGWRDASIDSVGLPASLSATICAHLGDPLGFSAELEPDPLRTTLRLTMVALETGEAARSLVVVSDVTDRARLEAVRRDFVANASHELKTPVAGIQLLASSAETAATDGDVEQSLRFTRQIEAEANRLKRLVGDLLDLSRLESAPQRDAVTDVRVAIDHAIAGHRAAVGRRELALDVNLRQISGIDVFAKAEPTDVAVALDNLLDNAIAYTEQGGVTIRVRASSIAVEIDVSDTGPGIAPEHLSRIFERFYRVDRARSRESGGTGLGLALVRHVAERSGGTVAVSSEVGAGTTFTIQLPRAV